MISNLNMGNLEVLIIDDDRIALMLHTRIISKTGFFKEPKEFLNGLTALNHILESDAPGKTFILFLDINMPIMGGWDLLNQLQSKPIQSELFVFMVTSSIDPDDKYLASTYPMVKGYLGKPLYDSVIEKLMVDQDIQRVLDAAR
jgi:CheY-like chemotaxis protein